MPLDEHLKSLNKPISVRTVCFLVKDEKVLLGRKKRGFGQGRYVGIGGKLEEGEGINDAAVREIREETGIEVNPTDLKESAVLTFLFSEKPHWNQRVHALMTYKWTGTTIETEEIAPEWFSKDKIPFNQMWDDNKYWIPNILNGAKLRGTFIYNGDLMVQRKEITAY